MNKKRQNNKKSDDRIQDEENNFIQQQLAQSNEEKVDLLVQHVSQMHQISSQLGAQLSSETSVLKDLGSGFDRSKELVGKVIINIDGMLEKASGSILPFVVVFTVMILALIAKLQ